MAHEKKLRTKSEESHMTRCELMLTLFLENTVRGIRKKLTRSVANARRFACVTWKTLKKVIFLDR